MGKNVYSKEESLFATEGIDFTPPPSPLVEAQRKRRTQELARQREMVRTKDDRAASAREIMAEWVSYITRNGFSSTDVPEEIKARVGRSLRSLIAKGYLYDEIVFALRTFTMKDLRNRKSIPRIGNLEIYARQFRGEDEAENAANNDEAEKLREEALSRGEVPTTGTARQNARDAAFIALKEAAEEMWGTNADSGATESAPQIEAWRGTNG